VKHVDDFIGDHDSDDYASFFLFLSRLSAFERSRYGRWIGQYKLFCTYQGKRYRCTGASRLGDVWLATNFDRDTGYDLRVDVAECSEWGPEARR
jgi:hypothetical protein